MKVTIDTQHDSYEDIHKVYQILANILQRKGNNVPAFSESTPETPIDTTNLMNMFDSPSPSSEKNIPEKAPDFSSFLNLTKETSAKKEEKVEIEYY